CSIPAFFGSLTRFLFYLIGGILIYAVAVTLINSYLGLTPSFWLTSFLLHANYTIILFAHLAILFAWAALDFVIILVRIERDSFSGGTTSIAMLLLKILVVISTSDLLFAWAYITFSQTDSSNHFNQSIAQESLDLISASDYYLKSLYFAFCTHFALALPSSE